MKPHILQRANEELWFRRKNATMDIKNLNPDEILFFTPESPQTSKKPKHSDFTIVGFVACGQIDANRPELLLTSALKAFEGKRVQLSVDIKVIDD